MEKYDLILNSDTFNKYYDNSLIWNKKIKTNNNE